MRYKPIKDITNQKFSRLKVVKFLERTKTETLWLCKCDCGKEVIVSSCHLRTGHTKSCGCYHDEVSKNNGLKIKHGMSKSKLYKTWVGMKTRCFNPNSEHYKYYMGRGITMCDEWRNDFTNFYNWAIRNGYSKNLTIDRIDVNGNYQPSNCRWATVEEQNRNKTTKKK